MRSRLYRAAFLSSPIIALLISSPLFAFEKLSADKFILAYLVSIGLVFTQWLINIFAITSSISFNSKSRYFKSYLGTVILHIIFFSILDIFVQRPQSVNIIFPIFGQIAINTIILILSNNILLLLQKEKTHQENIQLKNENHEAQKIILHQQLQPHFLFNAMSVLKSLIAQQPDVAEDYIVKLSNFLRYSTVSNQQATQTLDKELNFTKDYIDLQKIRFGDALKIHLDIPANILQHSIPVFALQLLIENAIKHNKFTTAQPLMISVLYKDTYLIVTNNLNSRLSVVSTGLGLKNLNERYQLICNAPLAIEQNDQEFTVKIKVIA
jgi:two-component system, LytTR family, sensor kinase